MELEFLRKEGCAKPSKRRLELDKDVLEELYSNKKMSISDVANVLGWKKSSIYNKLKKYDITIRSVYERNTGSNNPRWHGGCSDYWHRQARKIMEKYIGRKLNKNEIVHHRNENEEDNRIENLELIGWGEHSTIHQMGLNNEDRNKWKMINRMAVRSLLNTSNQNLT